LVVSQIGADGRTTALTNGATDLILKELTSSGATVQILSLSTAGSASITIPGNSTLGGHVTSGPTGMAVGGFLAPLGLSAVISTDASQYPRGIAFWRTDGTLDRTTRLVDAYSRNELRAVADDGFRLWTAGTSSGGGSYELQAGARTTTLGASTSTQLTGANFFSPANVRFVAVHSGNLYLLNSEAGEAGVYAFGGQPITQSSPQLLPGLSQGFSPSVISGTTVWPNLTAFGFADAQTLYVAEENTRSTAPTSGPERGGIYKFTRNGVTGVWSLAYRLKAGLPGFSSGTQTVGARSLCVTKNPSGQPVLYVVSGEAAGQSTGVYRVVDTGPTVTFALVSRSAANTCYRGVAIVPTAPTSNRTVSGTVSLSGSWSGSTSGANQVNATLVINDGAAAVDTPLNFVNGVAGFSINVPASVGSGAIKVSTKFGTFLRRALTGVNLGSTGIALSMRNGDVDADGDVSILDYLNLSNAYESTVGSWEYGDGSADLDKDGEVSILDYIILSSNYEASDDH
jgi:hypothetical protein